jgi:hypothetical protein|tara:strand:+ start:380 stop:541 length:162 start_codon:yes stop_codon:yes gene_type:complete
MIPFILATTLTCSEADQLISKMIGYNVSEETRAEMISTVKGEAKADCWDAKAD